MATVSVCILNYNYAQYLEKALRSHLEQTLTPLELIVFDDASTDGSQRLIESIIEKYPFARLIRHERNQGVVKTINEAILTAKGSFLYLGSSDDWVEPEFLAKSMDLISKNPNLGLTTTLPMYSHDSSVSKPSYHGADPTTQVLQPINSKKLFQRTNFSIATISTIYNRKLLLEYGLFDEKLGGLSDWYIMFKIASRHPIGFIPEHLGTTRVHQNSYSAAISKNRKNLDSLYDTFIDKMSSDGDFHRYFLDSGIAFYLGKAFRNYLLRRPGLWKYFPRMLAKALIHKFNQIIT